MIKELIEDIRKWQRNWDMYDTGLVNKKPINSDEFEKFIKKKYNIL